MTPADIGAELWPQFDSRPAEIESSPTQVEKDTVARMDAAEVRRDEPIQPEPSAPVEAEARVERREVQPEPPPPPPPPEAPAPEAQAEEPPVPKRSGWWRRR